MHAATGLAAAQPVSVPPGNQPYIVNISGSEKVKKIDVTWSLLDSTGRVRLAGAQTFDALGGVLSGSFPISTDPTTMVISTTVQYTFPWQPIQMVDRLPVEIHGINKIVQADRRCQTDVVVVTPRSLLPWERAQLKFSWDYPTHGEVDATLGRQQGTVVVPVPKHRTALFDYPLNFPVTNTSDDFVAWTLKGVIGDREIIRQGFFPPKQASLKIEVEHNGVVTESYF